MHYVLYIGTKVLQFTKGLKEFSSKEYKIKNESYDKEKGGYIYEMLPSYKLPTPRPALHPIPMTKSKQ